MKPMGICPAMMTAWGKDEMYDKKSSEKYVSWLLDNGAEAISVCGSTGEMTAMYLHEQKEIIDHVVKFVAGQVPVIAGSGKYTTLETLDLSKSARESGADGLLIILPYYYKPYKEAVKEHYRTVKKEVGLPIYLYNNPHFAGYEFTAEEAVSLYKEKTIDGIKSAHGDANRVSDLRAMSDMTIFYGHDYSALAGFAAGADGWLSGFPAAFPKQCRELEIAVRDEKDIEKGIKIWNKFVPFVQVFMDPAVNAQCHWLEMLKYCLLYQGVDIGFARRPCRELNEAAKKKLNPVLDILLG